MACFLVPVAEAVVVTGTALALAHREKVKLSMPEHSDVDTESQSSKKVSLSKKLMYLASLLWGGSILLAFEHFWHGEVVPFFPFLSAAANPQDAAEMLHEMGTVGVTMALACTVAWAVAMVVLDALKKKAMKTDKVAE